MTTNQKPVVVGGVGASVLSIYHVALGIGLLTALVWLWPIGGAEQDTSCLLFEKAACGREVRLILLVATAGALGSFVHAATSLSSYIGNRTFVWSWVWWYLLRPFIGMGLAEVVYFAIRGGLLAVSVNSGATDSLNHFGIVALGGLVGMFSKQATDKLREVFDTMFRTQTANERKDKLRSMVPVLTAVEPKTLVQGTSSLQVTLVGSAFTEASEVQVNGAPRRTEFLSPTSLVVTLDPADVANPGTLDITVVNSEPNGGSSQAVQVTVA